MMYGFLLMLSSVFLCTAYGDDMCPGNREFFSCGQECDNVCSKLHIQNRTNCPIVNIVCNKKCYCEDGYARDDDKKCVPIEQCPNREGYSRTERDIQSEPECGPNEEYTPCKVTCPPETCISIAAFFKCASNQPCQPRCTCKPGFLRLEEDAPCMPSCQCPQLVNSPNCNM